MASTGAFFSGGFQEGFASSEKARHDRETDAAKLDISRGNLALGQRGADQQDQLIQLKRDATKQALTGQAREQLRAGIGRLRGDLAEAAKGGREDMMKLAQSPAYRVQVQRLIENGQRIGVDVRSEIDTFLQSIPSATAVGQTEGAQLGAKETAQRQALTAGGLNPEEAKQATGSRVAPEKPTPRVYEVTLDDGQRVDVTSFNNDTFRDPVTGEERKLVEARPVVKSVQTPAAQNVAQKTADREGAKNVAKLDAAAQAKESSSVQTMAEASDMMQRALDTPGVTGIRGRASEALGGWLGNLVGLLDQESGESVEDFVTQKLSGVSPQELSKFRTTAKRFVSRLLPTITEENSGRYTDTERKIAAETARSITPDSTPAQIVGSMKTFIGIEMAGRLRADFRRGIAAPGTQRFDVLNSQEDQIAVAQQLLRLGYTPDEAADFVADLVEEFTMVRP